MPRRSYHMQDMGEPISFEDVMSLLTVIFVLFFLFMVPIVNIDKAKTVNASSDPYWGRLIVWLLENPGSSEKVEEYRAALDIDGHQVRITDLLPKKLRYIELVAPDSSLTVVAQDLESNTFVSMLIQEKGGIILYRTGYFRWSPIDKEWFTDAEHVLVGTHNNSRKMREAYRRWTGEIRGF